MALLPLSLFSCIPLHAQHLWATNEVIDCGYVVYEQPVTAKFELMNKGSLPLKIREVKLACGCTQVEYPKGEISPGDTFTLNATYDARQMGHFSKDIAIYSDGSQQPFFLTLRGVVVDEVVAFTGQYPYTIGDLEVDCINVEYDDVNSGDLPVQRIHVSNVSGKNISPVVMHLPPYLEAHVSPTTLPPGRQGTITLTLDSRKVRDYGLTQTSVFLGMFPGDKVHPDKEISVSAVLLPSFGEMTGLQIFDSPRLLLSSDEVNFSLNGKSKLTETIIVENRGRALLDISTLQMYTTGMSVKLNKTKLKPGEQAKLKITVDAKEIKKARSKPRVLMITNDPKRSKAIINVNVK